MLCFVLHNYAENSAAYILQICRRHYPFLEPGDCKRGIMPHSGYPQIACVDRYMSKVQQYNESG